MRSRWTASFLVLLAALFVVPLVFAAAPPGQMVRQGPAIIPAGTGALVRTSTQIAIGTAKPGDIFRATLEDDIVADGKVLVRRGAPAEIRLMKVREDLDELAFKLHTITVGGKKLRVVSDTAREAAQKGAPKQPTLGGALGQAALGSALGTGPGGLSWSGAARQSAKVPAGSLLEFTLREDVKLGK